MFNERSHERCNEHIGEHLDGECGAQDGPGPACGQVEREQTQSHRQEAGPQKRDDLRGEEVAVGGKTENCQHAPNLDHVCAIVHLLPLY